MAAFLSFWSQQKERNEQNRFLRNGIFRSAQYDTLPLKNALTEDILARLTDENGAEINTTRVNKAIEFASTLIDAHLEGSYPTPININSPLLTGIAVTLATFRLYLDSCGDDAPDSVSTAYTEALNLLVKLQNGELNLKTQRQNETLTNKTPCDKLFSRRFLGGL